MQLPSLGVVALATAAVATPIPNDDNNTIEERSFGNFRNDILGASNWFRKAHGANKLVWNDAAAASAQKWANQCKWQHQVRLTSNILISLWPSHAGKLTPSQDLSKLTFITSQTTTTARIWLLEGSAPGLTSSTCGVTSVSATTGTSLASLEQQATSPNWSGRELLQLDAVGTTAEREMEAVPREYMSSVNIAHQAM